MHNISPIFGEGELYYTWVSVGKSLIGALRDYSYPHMQRHKTVAGVQNVYAEKADYYQTITNRGLDIVCERGSATK